MKFEYLLPIAVIPWLWCFGRLAMHLRREDRFLMALYRDHRDIWESLGKPCGWQWSPPGRFASPFSSFTFDWDWLRHDPVWLERAPELRDSFHRIRDEFREWNFRSMPVMVVSAVVFFLLVKIFEPL